MSYEEYLENEELIDHLYLVFKNYIPLCGCGNPQAGRNLAYEILNLMPFRSENKSYEKAVELCGSEGSFHIVMGLLDHGDFIDHSSTFASSRLTGAGEWFLWAINKIGGVEKLYEYLKYAGFPHTDDANKPQTCTNSCWTITAL